jgi:cytochrome c
VSEPLSKVIENALTVGVLGMAIGIASVAVLNQPVRGADLKRGALLFQTCTACHSVLGDGVGPDISQIYGKKAASQAGFPYSAAMKASGIIWDDASLRAFIANPQGFVRGTAMTFPGYANPMDVEDVISYLKSANWQ